MLLRLLSLRPIHGALGPAEPVSRPAAVGPWLLPKVCDLHPLLLRDRFRGDLTRWIDALSPRLLAAWEAEDRQRLEEGRYAGWQPDGAPEALLERDAVLVRGNAWRRQGRNGQATPPRAEAVRFVHRLRFVETQKGLRLDALEEAHWGDWRQAEIWMRSPQGGISQPADGQGDCATSA